MHWDALLVFSIYRQRETRCACVCEHLCITHKYALALFPESGQTSNTSIVKSTPRAKIDSRWSQGFLEKWLILAGAKRVEYDELRTCSGGCGIVIYNKKYIQYLVLSLFLA